MTRRTRTTLLAAVACAAVAWLGAAGPAAAGANNCTYDGQPYPEGAVICQAGLRNLCMNGVWQTGGSFCNGTPDGAIIGGSDVPVVIREPAVVEDDD